MSDLPHGWTHATIEQLAGAQGMTTDGDWIETKDQDPDGDVRLIQLADIGDGEFRDRSARFVTSQTAHRLNCTFLEKDDLLIARMPDPIGRACIFPGVGQPAITAVDVFVWRPSPDGPSARWLMHFINSTDVRNRIAAQAGGTTRQRIAGGRVKRLDLPVPPLPEQRRIVAKIDSLSAKSKRASDQLDRIPRLVEKYKQAVLGAAFRGELTREWRKLGGPETVAHNLAARPTDAQKRQRRTIEGFTNRIGIEFYELPAGWHYKSIGSLLNEGALIDFADGNHGSDYPRKQEFGDEGAIFVTAAQIRNGRVYFDECALLNWDKARKLRKGWARTGDVLLTHNATVGRVAIVEDAIDPFLLGTSVTYYRTDQSLLLNRFLFWAFCSPIFQDQLRAIMGQTTRNQVPITRQAYIELPIAPAAEQQEIVRRIDMALRWVDRLASETTSARKLVDHLDQAVLAKAFRGELVPQDPNDEPASVLLERIQAERHAPTTARGRKGQQNAPRQRTRR
jgi:type I restriction enzyme, S subunit